MVRRNKHKSEELMLIPFLDILCSLIGVLVLIIVVLVIAQTQRINGRTPEELKRAQEYLRMTKLKEENVLKFSGLEDKLKDLEKLKEESAAKAEQRKKLQDMLANADELREKAKVDLVEADKLRIELENLKVEIRGLTDAEPDLRKKVAQLLEDIAKIQPPEKKDPRVVVNPAGSGLAEGTVIFFVDASGDKLAYYWNDKSKSVVAATPEVIVADANFNTFLDSVKKIPNSKLIFLLRDDGMKGFNLGAGWAQSKHGFKPEQVGKLPVPGRGDLDMKLFGKLLGNLPAPPPGPADAPAAAPMPGAPAMPGAPTPAKPGTPPAPQPSATPGMQPPASPPGAPPGPQPPKQ
jgi:hypothetical protein